MAAFISACGAMEREAVILSLKTGVVQSFRPEAPALNNGAWQAILLRYRNDSNLFVYDSPVANTVLLQ